MPFNQELANQLSNFLAGDLSLLDYRKAMMHFRLEKLESVQDRDKNFVYEFETRYAQLKADAITEYQFRQLLGYAAACESASTQSPELSYQFTASEKKPAQSVVTSAIPQTATERTLELV